jgi:fructose-1,6-bisphosphatase/inositol monophosphatase family enzyme
MPTPNEIIAHLLPFVFTAGQYSLAIQKTIGTHPAKDGTTIFHHALSDADLTIQSYLEVALLAKYPEISFFSEEQDQSLNVKYFAEDAEIEVLLDPIDGTRSYIDNRDHFQIIVTIHDRSQIVGVLCSMPRRNRCYTAIKGEGAYCMTAEDYRAGNRGQRVQVQANQGPILLFNSPDIEQRLSSSFVVRDLAFTYNGGATPYDSTDLIDSRASGVVLSNCQAIDGGALAFIASEAGAVVSDFAGNPMGNFRAAKKRVLPNILVAADSNTHVRLLKLLG